jgi:hypothetical protein
MTSRVQENPAQGAYRAPSDPNPLLSCGENGQLTCQELGLPLERQLLDLAERMKLLQHRGVSFAHSCGSSAD